MFVFLLNWFRRRQKPPRYCKQCAERLQKENTLSGLCSEYDVVQAKCGGCGKTTVTVDGMCVSPWCRHQHGVELVLASQNDDWRR